MHSIEEAEIGAVADLEIADLQRHFGRESLTLALKGASEVRLDFSDRDRPWRGSLRTNSAPKRARSVGAELCGAVGAVADEPPFDRMLVT